LFTKWYLAYCDRKTRYKTFSFTDMLTQRGGRQLRYFG
jgi:hypothetical protein